jgi:hypothetical protein
MEFISDWSQGIAGHHLVTILASHRSSMGHQPGIRQQALARVGKLHCWSINSPTLARWPEDDMNFVGLQTD